MGTPGAGHVGEPVLRHRPGDEPDLAELARVEQRPHVPVLRREEALNGERHDEAALLGEADELLSVGARRDHRLVDEHGTPGRERVGRLAEVQPVRARDDDPIELDGLEHGAVVDEGRRVDADPSPLLLHRIRNRDDRGARAVQEVRQAVAHVAAAADEAEPDLAHRLIFYNRNSRRRSVVLLACRTPGTWATGPHGSTATRRLRSWSTRLRRGHPFRRRGAGRPGVGSRARGPGFSLSP